MSDVANWHRLREPTLVSGRRGACCCVFLRERNELVLSFEPFLACSLMNN